MLKRRTAVPIAVILSMGIFAASLALPARADDKLVPVKIAMIPTLDAGPLLLAKANGFFEKHGLDAKINAGGVGATIIPTVLSQEYAIGYANVVSDLQAIDRGLPLLLVHAAYSHPRDPNKDPYRVYVDPNGPIKDPRQLAEANIATSSVANIAEWTTKKSLENLGVTDFTKQKWTRVTGQDAITAVKNKEVDAVWFPQPDGASAVASGLVPILSANTGSLPGAVGGYFITSKAFAEKNAAVLAKFSDAIDEANAYANLHPNEGRDLVVNELRFDRKLVDAADLNDYPSDPNVASLKIIANDLVRYGLIKKLPNFEEIFWRKD
jgi:NitT/TauT family transport system substrate-binding protein